MIVNMTGAGGAFSATLAVTTDAGAAVSATCAGNGKTYSGTAGEDGICMLNIRASGTYTVTATLNGVSETGRIAIADRGESHAMDLYIGMYLYRHGDERQSLTGGWINHDSGANGSFTKGEDAMTIYSGAYSHNIRPAKMIDLTGVTALRWLLTTHTAWAYIGVTKKTSDYFNAGTISANWTSSPSKQVNPGDANEVLLDVSSLTGSYYVVLASRKYTTEGATDVIFSELECIRE